MSRRSERGLALLAVVAALGVVMVAALGLAAATARELRRTGDTLAGLQADALVRSGVATATSLLAEPGLRDEPDTLRALWARPTGRHELGVGWVEADVEDEARRLDLTAPEHEAALVRLLQELRLDPGLADALADWTDTDDVARPRGAEQAWYADRRPALAPTNRPLGTLGELRAVRGFTPAVLARLRPFVSVAGEGRVNPNTAPREVLRAWLGDAAAVDSIVGRRPHEVIACTDLPGCTTRARHYTVRVRAGAGRVRREVEAMVWVAGARTDVTAWRAVSE